jgi:hypothetical protein
MKNILYQLDFLGFQPYITVNGKERFQTIFTGILSTLVIILTILCTFYFGREIINRDQPLVLTSNQQNKDFGPLNMSNQDYLFIFAMEAKNHSFYVDNSIFTVNSTYLIKRNILKDGKLEAYSEIKSVEVDLCSTYYQDKDIIEKNIKFPLNKFYCLKPNSVSLRGFFGSDYYSQVKIIVNKCVNTTWNNNKCKPQSIIDDMVQGSFISMDMSSVSVDQKDYSNPLQRQFFNSFNMLNTNSSLYYSFHIFPVTLQSDDGFLFQNLKFFNGYNTKIDLFNVISRNDNIITFALEGYASGPLYIRTYIKIQTVLTNIGGFCKAILMIASLLSKFISKTLFYIIYISENNIKFKKLKKIELKSNKHYKGTMYQLNTPTLKKNNRTNMESQCNQQIMSASNMTKIDTENAKYKSPKVLSYASLISKQSQKRILLRYLCNYLCFWKKRDFKTSIIENLKKSFAMNMSFENLSRKSLELEIIKKYITHIDFDSEYKLLLENQIKMSIQD